MRHCRGGLPPTADLRQPRAGPAVATARLAPLPRRTPTHGGAAAADVEPLPPSPDLNPGAADGNGAHEGFDGRMCGYEE